MRVFVTGSEGRIGREVCKRLDEVVRYDKLLGNDVLDWDMLEAMMQGCDTVVHLAAHPHPVSHLTFDDYFENNTVGTYYVISCAAQLGVERFVYASSTSYYGFESGIEGVLVPAVETQAPAMSYIRTMNTSDAELAYSANKVMSEQIVAWHGLQKKLRTTILRFGPLAHWTSCESAGEAVVSVLSMDHWYDVFNVVNNNVKEVDGDKIRRVSER